MNNLQKCLVWNWIQYIFRFYLHMFNVYNFCNSVDVPSIIIFLPNSINHVRICGGNSLCYPVPHLIDISGRRDTDTLSLMYSTQRKLLMLNLTIMGARVLFHYNKSKSTLCDWYAVNSLWKYGGVPPCWKINSAPMSCNCGIR